RRGPRRGTGPCRCPARRARRGCASGWSCRPRWARRTRPARRRGSRTTRPRTAGSPRTRGTGSNNSAAAWVTTNWLAATRRGAGHEGALPFGSRLTGFAHTIRLPRRALPVSLLEEPGDERVALRPAVGGPEQLDRLRP